MNNETTVDSEELSDWSKKHIDQNEEIKKEFDAHKKEFDTSKKEKKMKNEIYKKLCLAKAGQIEQILAGGDHNHQPLTDAMKMAEENKTICTEFYTDGNGWGRSDKLLNNPIESKQLAAVLIVMSTAGIIDGEHVVNLDNKESPFNVIGGTDAPANTVANVTATPANTVANVTATPKDKQEDRPWWHYALAAALVAGVGYIAYNKYFKEDNEVLVLQEDDFSFL